MASELKKQSVMSRTSKEAVRAAREAFIRDNPSAADAIGLIFKQLGITDITRQHWLRPKLSNGAIDNSHNAHVRPLNVHDNGGQAYDKFTYSTIVQPAPKTPNWKIGLGLFVNHSTGQVWPRDYYISPDNRENLRTGPDLRMRAGKLVIVHGDIFEATFPEHAEHIVVDEDPGYFARSMKPFMEGYCVLAGVDVVHQTYEELD